MKSFVLAALIALSVATTGVVSANADTFAVHGYAGSTYGR